ncbi:MAG: DNA gyrase C-terminal beta-propeller domain-containing protein, partial [Hyphomicrobiales bacterium]
VGLAIAVANIDEVIALIRGAPDPATARRELMERRWPAKDVAPLVELIDDPRHGLEADGTYMLSEEQARAILDLRLQRLTALGRDEIDEELNKLGERIKDYLDILRSRIRIMSIIKDELTQISEEFSTPRRTEILEGGAELEDEDLIQREDMVITVTHGGYIKRVALDTYRAQKRGGKGRAGMSTKDEDFVTRLFVENTHTPILFFTSRGIVHKMKVWRLPLAAPNARGKALVNMLPLEAGERITTIMPLPEDEDSWDTLGVMFATNRGSVRRNKLSDFVQVNRRGKIAMKLDEGMDILGVEPCTEHDDVMLTTLKGQCIRFPVGDVRVFQSRDSTGVRGIRLADDDDVISMSIIRHFDAAPEERTTYLKQRRLIAGDTDTDETVTLDEDGDDSASDAQLSTERYAEMSAAEEFVLTLSENGYGKRSSLYEYRVSGRGGKGIAAMSMTKRNGALVASFPVQDSDQIMLVTDAGKLIRVPVQAENEQIRVMGRSTQGVTVFSTAEKERVVSVERISDVGEDDAEDEYTDGTVEGNTAAPEEGSASE